jgi:hypothetical protein
VEIDGRKSRPRRKARAPDPTWGLERALQKVLKHRGTVVCAFYDAAGPQARCIIAFESERYSHAQLIESLRRACYKRVPQLCAVHVGAYSAETVRAASVLREMGASWEDVTRMLDQESNR